MVDSRKINRTTQLKHNLFLLAEQLLGKTNFERRLGERRRRFEAKLAAAIQSPEIPEMQFVERRENLSAAEFLRDYFARGKPVIFSGAARDWPCTRSWNLDYFSLRHGTDDALLVDAEGLSGHGTSGGHEFLSLRDLVQNIKSGGDKYLRFSPLLQENPILTRDLDMAWLEARRPARAFAFTHYLFLGGAGTKTHLHSDQPCNLFVQIHGEKRWKLFLLEDSSFLYPAIERSGYIKSRANLEHPDHEMHPMLRHATPWEAVLKPGDVLYVPPHVWHYVENLTHTIAVGYRFSSLKAAMTSSPFYTMLRLLSLDPPIWKTMQYGKVDTNIIWAHAHGNAEAVLQEKIERSQLSS